MTLAFFFFGLPLATDFEASAGASAEGSGMGSGTTIGKVTIGEAGKDLGEATTTSAFLESGTMALAVVALAN